MGPDSLATCRYIGSLDSLYTISTRGAPFLFNLQSDDRLERVSLPDLHRSRVNGVFTGLKRGWSASLRWDGKEIVYLAPVLSSKLVMIENLR